MCFTFSRRGSSPRGNSANENNVTVAIQSPRSPQEEGEQQSDIVHSQLGGFVYPGTMSITSNNPLYSFNPSTYGIPNLKGAAHCYFVLRRIRFPQPPLLYISPLIVNETCMHNLIPSCNYTFACIVLKFRLLRRSCTLNGGGGGGRSLVRKGSYPFRNPWGGVFLPSLRAALWFASPLVG